MIDVPDIEHQQHERSRLHTHGRRTDNGERCTLLLIHELDGSWTIHGLGAEVTLPAADMVALASTILKDAPVSARGVDKWRDVVDVHIPDQCRVQQVGVAKLHGALPSRLHKLGRVVGRGFTRVHVQFDDEAEITSVRPHLVRVVGPTTSLERAR